MSTPGKAADMEDVRRLNTPGQTVSAEVQSKGNYGFLFSTVAGGRTAERESPLIS